jgi:hypothetical protein
MNFKKRIEELKAISTTNSVIDICNETLTKYNEYDMKAEPATIKMVEAALSEILIEKLKATEDKGAHNFIANEMYIQSLNNLNLGVSESIDKIKGSDLVSYPSAAYLIESINNLPNKHEWSVVEVLIEKLKPFNWHSTVNECISSLTESFRKYELDIRLYGALQNSIAENNPFVEKVKSAIFEYLTARTEDNKKSLMESLVKYKFDAAVSGFHSVMESVDMGGKYASEKLSEKIETHQKKEALKNTTSLKQRISHLMESSNSIEVMAICNEALSALQGYADRVRMAQPQEMIAFESSIQEVLIEKLSQLKGEGVESFLMVETRIYEFNNMGVRKALLEMKNSDLAKLPSTMYLVERLQQYTAVPEWMSIHNVLEGIKTLQWHDLVQEKINILEFNAKKFKEDINIHKVLHESKNSKSNFILSSIEPLIVEYLNNRTATNRTTLLEKLGNFTYDVNLKNLYNVILESEKSFQLKADSNDVTVSRVYSPVIINEATEIFAIRGKVFIKEGGDIRPLSESEVTQLPSNFVELSAILSQPNISVSENCITVYNRNQKAVINENQNNEVVININEKMVSMDEFRQVYLKSGIFNSNDLETIKIVQKIVENWHTIFEMDYVKTITPNFASNRKMDIFKLGHEIFVNREDSLMQENIFYPKCNATQAKHMVKEFTSYDLGNTFTEMLSEESKYIKMFEERKSQLSSVINKLQSKKNQLLDIQDQDLKESNEVKDLIAILEDEITKVKEEYSVVNREYKKFIQVQESVSTGDMVEYLKKKA